MELLFDWTYRNFKVSGVRYITEEQIPLEELRTIPGLKPDEPEEGPYEALLFDKVTEKAISLRRFMTEDGLLEGCFSAVEWVLEEVGEDYNDPAPKYIQPTAPETIFGAVDSEQRYIEGVLGCP